MEKRELKGKKARLKVQRVTWYYDSTEKEKKDLTDKNFDKRGHKKTRDLATPTHILFKLSGASVRSAELAQSQGNL